MEFFNNTLDFFLDAAPWLVFGLVTAGLIKAWIPDDLITRLMGGGGMGSVVRAALVGAPLPLCSCGVLPVALGIRRNGASKGATVSFLIATPETGVDSIAVSHALLGPFMAIARPIAAVLSAILAGFMLVKIEKNQPSELPKAASSCSSGKCCPSNKKAAKKISPLKKSLDGLHYAFTSILDDMSIWLAVGLIVAGGVATMFPPEYLAQWGGGLGAMLVMLMVGAVMYICATASTPVAAALLHVGVSPGAVMVFLLAGPATNMATLMVVKKELGNRATVAYLAGISIGSIVSGLLVDYLLVTMGWDLIKSAQYSGEILPGWLAWSSLSLLVLFSIPPVRNSILYIGKPKVPSTCSA